MLEPICTVAILSCAAPLPPPRGDADPNKPVLIAKGKDFFIHALPADRGLFPRRVKVEPRFPEMVEEGVRGLVVVHTSLATGDMKILTAGGQSTWRGPPMGIDRIYHNVTRVVGIAADSERLYVLLWDDLSEWVVGERGKRGYRLQIFRVSNGALLHTLALKEGDFPKDPPSQETAEKGPLQLRGDGVACFGVTFEFKGMELIKQKYEPKKPPPERPNP